MGIASGLSHFVQSIVEVFQGIISTIFHLFQSAISAVAHLFQFVVNSIIGVFQGFVHFVEGTLGFAIHNFFILGTLAAVVLGYMMYTQKQGTAPVSRTVKNK